MLQKLLHGGLEAYELLVPTYGRMQCQTFCYVSCITNREKVSVYTVLYTYPLFAVQGSEQYNVYVDLNLGQKAWEIVILRIKGTVA